MANTTVNIDIKVQSKSLGELEQELEDINAQLKQVPIGSQAFEDLSKEAQGLTKDLEKANLAAEGFTDDKKFQAAEGSIKILGGSLAAVVGTLGTLGIESEVFGDMEKKAASVIAAMIGFRDVAEGVRQATTAVKGLTKAQLASNAAALANPYVAVGVAIAALTAGFAKYASTLTDDVVPTTETLKNMFFSLGNGMKFAQLQAESYTKNLEKLNDEQDDLNMDRAIQVLQAFGENTLDLEIQRAEKQLEILVEGSEEYEDKLTELSVLRARKAKQLQDKELEDLEKARRKKLEEILFSAEARKFAEEKYAEAGEEDAREYARGVVQGFDKLKEEGFNIFDLAFEDIDALEAEIQAEDSIAKLREDSEKELAKGVPILEEALDKAITKKDRWSKFFDLANQAFENIADLSRERYERQLLLLERERNEITTNANLSEEERIKALNAVEAKERQLEIKRIKAERDQFTLKQTLLLAESVIETNLFVQKLKAEGQLALFKAQDAGTELAVTTAVQVAKAQSSLGAFVAALGPFGVAAFALSIGGIIASIISARRKAQAQIGALTSAPVGGGGVDTSLSIPSTPAVPQSAEERAPQTFDVAPTSRAYVLAGDVTSNQEAEAKLNTKRTII